MNTLRNEYRQLGLELDVVHHTQLLNRLVREGRLTPAAAPAGAAAGRTITYHDPCYLGRHNQVYAPPRELLGGLSRRIDEGDQPCPTRSAHLCPGNPKGSRGFLRTARVSRWGMRVRSVTGTLHRVHR